MIASLRGNVQSKEPDSMIIEVAGIGYQVYVTARLLQRFGLGDEIFLYTYQHVREDAILLYGFLQRSEKDLFLLLQNVSGIGPKASLGIMNHTVPDLFVKAVQEENLAYLLELPGVGKKTAQRLILELKEKLPVLEVHDLFQIPNAKNPKPDFSFVQDVSDTLTALGYNDKEIRETLKKLQKEESLEAEVQTWVKAALRHLTSI